MLPNQSLDTNLLAANSLGMSGVGDWPPTPHPKVGVIPAPRRDLVLGRVNGRATHKKFLVKLAHHQNA